MQDHSAHRSSTGSGAKDGRAGRMDHGGHYGRLAAMSLLSFACMYALMYAMIDRFANVLPNVNQLYMAGLMTAPMAILEVLMMGSMYRDKRRNAAILVLASLLLAGCWFAIRAQVGVDDRQFLKSMIPHHAGAILMCREADLADADIQALCRSIVTGQQAEIERMKSLLASDSSAGSGRRREE